jgi:hypothetical protein
MRSIAVAVLLASPLACASVPPPPPVAVEPEAPVSPPSPGRPGADEAAALAGVPRVVQRLLAEEKDLIERSVAMANELPDPSGRRRALAEANALAAELAEVEAPLAGADSDRLDALVAELIRLETRITLLHESLRNAMNRTTALTIE